MSGCRRLWRGCALLPSPASSSTERSPCARVEPITASSGGSLSRWIQGSGPFAASSWWLVLSRGLKVSGGRSVQEARDHLIPASMRRRYQFQKPPTDVLNTALRKFEMNDGFLRNDGFFYEMLTFCLRWG